MRKLEATAKARQRTLASAVEAVNNRPGLLATATVDDAAVAATAAPYQWATADDQDRADMVERAVTRRVIDSALSVVPILAKLHLGVVSNVSELGLPAAWSDDYAKTVLGLLRDMLPLEDGSYVRQDRDIVTTNDGHLDLREYARQALIDRGLPSDESHIEALLVAAE